MKDSKFSIILPTFNRKDYIKKAIDSALAQNYPRSNFEIIVIDDGSTDGTEELVRSLYAKELEYGLITFTRLNTNRGASFARNQGLKLAKNDWIAYLDTDNSMRNNFLRIFSDNIKSHSENDIFYAKIKHMHSKKSFGENFNFSELIFANFIDLGAFVHSKKAYKKIGGFDENLKRLIDWDLIIKYTEKLSPIFINEIVVDYYDGNDIPRISNSHSQAEYYKKVIINYFSRLSAEKFISNRMEEKERINIIEKKEVQIRKLKKDLAKKEEQLVSVVSTLRWKIPNFFYKFYAKRIRKYIPKFVIIVFKKITYFFEFCFRMTNKYYNLSRMAKDEWKMNGWNGLSFALKRHWQKRRGKILVSYPTKSDYEKNLVSIGILTINHLDLIKPCIESIEKNLSQKYEVEVLIGDTGSTEKEVWKFYKKAQKKYRNIKIIKFKSYFFSRNYNDLVKMRARGEYLIFLNNDTIVKENWIDNLVNPLKNKKIGIVGGKLLYQNETIQHAGIEINEKGNFAHKFSKEKSDLPEANYSALVPAVTFACVATRHDTFDRFKLSEDFREESQDTDFCLRLQEAGFDVLYEPSAEIYHLECSTRDWRKGSPDHTAFHEKYKEKIEQILKSQQRIRFDNNKYEKSISVIRDDGIGDLLMAVSAFKNLKEKYQNKKLILLTYERNIEMMKGFKIFDEILPIPNGLKYSPLPIPTPKDRTFNLIDMEMKFGHTFAKAKDSNKINRHLVLAEKLKVDKKYELIPMPEYPEAKREIEKILSEMNVDFNQNFVVFNLIASNPARSWWEPYYPILIKAVEELGFTPLIVGTENSPYFQGEKIVNLVGKTKNIQEYIEAVKLGKYVISTDTSAYHIAALAGIPFLAIFTGGVLPEARLQNYEKYEVIKPKNLSCYPCWDEGCKDMSLRHKKDPCRLIIKPEQVIEKFKRLIKKY